MLYSDFTPNFTQKSNFCEPHNIQEGLGEKIELWGWGRSPSLSTMIVDLTTFPYSPLPVTRGSPKFEFEVKLSIEFEYDGR